MSDYVIVSTKLYPEVEDDKYIILCNFGGLSMFGFGIIQDGGAPSPPPPPHKSQEAKKNFSTKSRHKNKWLNEVNCSRQRTNTPPREYRGNNFLHFPSTKEEFHPLHPLRILMAFPLGKLSVKY